MLHQLCNLQVSSIFLLPPSLDTTRRLLTIRGKERGIVTNEDIEKRINAIKNYINHADNYDYIVVNHNLGETADIVKNIYLTEKLRSQKTFELHNWKLKKLQ